jgi:tetratricopeptide (TPR) repeat protein
VRRTHPPPHISLDGFAVATHSSAPSSPPGDRNGEASTLLAEGAIARDSSDVAKIAKAITVRIEGSTQGSGVIVKRDSNRYTVLTAWHVVSGNRPGEEVAIFTSDGKEHKLEQGSIQRLGQVDMAVFTFNTSGAYDVASIGEVKNVSSGNPIFVAGYPLPTTSVPTSIWRFLNGDVIANATVAIPDGYQLLYSNPTLPGMSGGSVLNGKGELVGIHGKSERDDQISMKTGKAVSTGTNQAVPISYYKKFLKGGSVVATTKVANTFDDYIAIARSAIFGDVLDTSKAVKFSSKALAAKNSQEAYFIRSIALSQLNQLDKALTDVTQAINLDNNNHIYISNRAIIHARRGDFKKAINDFNRALDIYPDDSEGLANRAEAHRQVGNLNQARLDIVKSLILSPNNPLSLNVKGAYLLDAGRPDEALLEFNRAIKLMPNFPQFYINKANAHRKLGQANAECLSLVLAAGQGSTRVNKYLKKPEQKWCIDFALSVVGK